MWSVWLVFCDCGFHSVCLLMDKDKSPMETSWWERLWEKLVLVLMGGARLSKSLIQFSVDGWGCVPFLLFDLRPNYGGGNEDNGASFSRPHARTAALSAPTLQQPPPTHASTRDFWTLTGKSGSASCGVTAPFSWVLVTQGFVCALQESVSPVLCKFCNQIPLLSKVKFSGDSQSLC